MADDTPDSEPAKPDPTPAEGAPIIDLPEGPPVWIKRDISGALGDELAKRRGGQKHPDGDESD
jgi:hypothetical protein